MAHFDDIIMPLTARFGSTAAPQTMTQMVTTTSGYRKTNRLWSQKLRLLRLTWLLRDTGIYELQRLWEAVEGPEHSFLARDWSDWNSTAGESAVGSETKVTNLDQPLRNTVTGLLVGDGATKTFQMEKHYGSGNSALHARVITKPEGTGLVIALDGGATSAFVFSPATGIVTFDTAPGAGVVPTWGGSFYIPVAFVDDAGFVQEMADAGIQGLDLTLREVRL